MYAYPRTVKAPYAHSLPLSERKREIVKRVRGLRVCHRSARTRRRICALLPWARSRGGLAQTGLQKTEGGLRGIVVKDEGKETMIVSRLQSIVSSLA